MENNNQFIDGLIVKAPHANAPDFVKAKLSIKRQELITWLQGQSGDWINADIKVSKQGKMYAQVDNWKPPVDGKQEGLPKTGGRAEEAGINPDDIPF